MTPDQKKLLDAIMNFELDDPNAAFSFTDRLVKENGWSYAYAIRCSVEYKRFIFLMCVAPHRLSPSDAVDQVWHLHLLYTESYWVDLCSRLLKKQIHHGPTRGGNDEKGKFENLYERTLSLYTEIFGQAPPEDIWPESSVRFREINFQRVNLQRNWIIRKPSFL